MTLEDAQKELGIVLPEVHRLCLENRDDPIHNACEFLLLESQHELLRLVEVNRFLHAETRWDPWPAFLVAFASNGCGDYFAYDTRTDPATIVYMDPDNIVAENLSAADKLTYRSFEVWWSATVSGEESEV